VRHLGEHQRFSCKKQRQNEKQNEGKDNTMPRRYEISNGINEWKTDDGRIVRSNTWIGEITITQDGQEYQIDPHDQDAIDELKQMIWQSPEMEEEKKPWWKVW